MEQLDEFVLSRGERVIDKGEFVAYMDGLKWRKQPKPRTVASLRREGLGKLVPTPVPISAMRDRLGALCDDVVQQDPSIMN